MTSPNPDDLGSHNLPALVDVDGQGPVFVADVMTLDNGWCRLREWDGASVKLPPHRVLAIRHLETERHGERRDDGTRPKRLADAEWRERVQGPVTNGDTPVIADD